MRNNWMKLTDFNHKYGITNRNHVHVVDHQKKPHWIKRYKASGKKAKQIAVNAGFLERAVEFRLKLFDEAYALYYEMMDNHESQLALSRTLQKYGGSTTQSWNDFLTRQLFSQRPEDYTILSPKVARRVVQFVRICRRLKSKQKEKIDE